jgi:predicted tellurium resistance membrane protein TerC
VFDLTPFLGIEGWISLLTLTALEVVLGIDNLVFLSIMTGKLPRERQPAARRLGLGLAVVMRVMLLVAMSWLVTLQAELFRVFGEPISGRDLILIGGGLFLVGKATHEIFDRMEVDHTASARPPRVSFTAVVLQIVLLDIVFSIDSVITAVGMARDLSIMVTAVVTAVLLMLAFAGSISGFIERHPSLKILALSFLILIGVVLVADGLGRQIPKGYVYFAMAFSLGIELLNLKLRARQAPLKLHGPFEDERPPPVARRPADS